MRSLDLFRGSVAIVLATSILIGLLLPIPTQVGAAGGVWVRCEYCWGTSRLQSWCRTGGCCCVSYVTDCICLAGCTRCGCVAFEGEHDGLCPGESIVGC